ncbi:hypothetical protein Q0590_35045 [Rhodocytophaga aerolata]|uniref:Uncharacterized protein n=1 Tax=Rhodocytophaga aerolata TaxID=455078 RepID=A0ABT8RJT6_9BACT|nr:hypothetical protein [Rhodocytophaga aerolata]MDO1451543.1 hypothetical protein [Rhodocytophaga aerolata]
MTTKTITFEITNEHDLCLLLALAERLKLKSSVGDENALTDHLDRPDGKPLSGKELLERLQKAESEKGIRFDEFKYELQK